MRPIKLTDFKPGSWGFGAGLISVWTFEDVRCAQSLAQRTYNGQVVEGKFSVYLDNQYIWSIMGSYTPELLWPEISIVLLDHGNICAPLELYGENVNLPSLHGPDS